MLENFGWQKWLLRNSFDVITKLGNLILDIIWFCQIIRDIRKVTDDDVVCMVHISLAGDISRSGRISCTSKCTFHLLLVVMVRISESDILLHKEKARSQLLNVGWLMTLTSY